MNHAADVNIGISSKSLAFVTKCLTCLKLFSSYVRVCARAHTHTHTHTHTHRVLVFVAVHSTSTFLLKRKEDFHNMFKRAGYNLTVFIKRMHFCVCMCLHMCVCMCVCVCVCEDPTV
jgi:hypothetical protein